jgi:hypothetical protein
MADILGALSKLQVEETDFNSAVSEALAQKIGANINALQDSFNLSTFNADGTFTSPANLLINYAVLWGAGGGGGGGGGSSGGTFGINPGGGGGAGAPVVFRIVPISAATNYAVDIGTGGTGGAGANSPGGNGNDGVAGSNTTFGGSLAIFRGASGGQGGVRNTSGSIPTNEIPGAGGEQRACGSSGGTAGFNGMGSGYSNGGGDGSGTYPGGGGGAAFGNGAAGGDSNGDNGSSASANTGAGGGGGGGDATDGGNGGAGGSGFLYVLTFGF